MEKSIELDCSPFNPRPDTLIGNVIKDTCLKLKKPISKLFGNWKWSYSEVSDNDWNVVKPILATRIKALYNNGTIRYGSW